MSVRYWKSNLPTLTRGNAETMSDLYLTECVTAYQNDRYVLADIAARLLSSGSPAQVARKYADESARIRTTHLLLVDEVNVRAAIRQLRADMNGPGLSRLDRLDGVGKHTPKEN